MKFILFVLTVIITLTGNDALPGPWWPLNVFDPQVQNYAGFSTFWVAGPNTYVVQITSAAGNEWLPDYNRFVRYRITYWVGPRYRHCLAYVYIARPPLLGIYVPKQEGLYPHARSGCW